MDDGWMMGASKTYNQSIDEILVANVSFLVINNIFKSYVINIIYIPPSEYYSLILNSRLFRLFISVNKIISSPSYIYIYIYILVIEQIYLGKLLLILKDYRIVS